MDDYGRYLEGATLRGVVPSSSWSADPTPFPRTPNPLLDSGWFYWQHRAGLVLGATSGTGNWPGTSCADATAQLCGLDKFWCNQNCTAVQQHIQSDCTVIGGQDRFDACCVNSTWVGSCPVPAGFTCGGSSGGGGCTPTFIAACPTCPNGQLVGCAQVGTNPPTCNCVQAMCNGTDPGTCPKCPTGFVPICNGPNCGCTPSSGGGGGGGCNPACVFPYDCIDGACLLGTTALLAAGGVLTAIVLVSLATR